MEAKTFYCSKCKSYKVHRYIEETTYQKFKGDVWKCYECDTTVAIVKNEKVGDGS